MLRTPPSPRHFILPRNLDEIPLFPPFYRSHFPPLPSISSSNSTQILWSTSLNPPFINFRVDRKKFVRKFCRSIENTERRDYLSEIDVTGVSFTRLWHATITTAWEIRGSTFYLCAYLTRMQVKYLDEVSTVRRDPSVRTLTRDKWQPLITVAYSRPLAHEPSSSGRSLSIGSSRIRFAQTFQTGE